MGFGTSAPELVVSVDAAMSLRPDIAIGNVVGSNIGNILLILGCCAVITPLTVTPAALGRDALMVIVASILFLMLADGNELIGIDAAIFLFALAAYLVFTYLGERTVGTPSATSGESESVAVITAPGSAVTAMVLVIVGLVTLIAGSHILLIGAVGMAAALGVSETAVGLILVAMGTSMPELSVSIVAAFRGHADVAIGNVLGSNIFNVLGILGIAATIAPLPIPERIMQVDQWVMLGASLALLLFLYTDRRLSRLEGGIFLLCYASYAVLSFTVLKH